MHSFTVTLSLVPVSLADRSQPKLPDTASFNLRQIWVLSPIACIGCFSIGLTNSAFRLVGPLLSSGLIDKFGPRSLFAYTTVVQVLLIVLILWRMRARAAVPSAERGRFVMLLRTSPAIFRLARRRK